MPIRTLAARTGLSPKTVRRHRDVLLRNGSLTLIELLSGAQARGLLMYNLYLVLPRLPPKDRHVVLTKLPRCITVRLLEEPPVIYLLCRAPSYAEVTKDEAIAKDLADGDAGLVFHLATEFAEERIEGWIDAEIASWDRMRRG